MKLSLREDFMGRLSYRAEGIVSVIRMLGYHDRVSLEMEELTVSVEIGITQLCRCPQGFGQPLIRCPQFRDQEEAHCP